MIEAQFDNVYGTPDEALVGPYAGARQFSPLMPGASSLELEPTASLSGLALLAPAGTLERHYTIAHALRALAEGAKLLVLAPKDKGGSRLAQDLQALGCDFEETSRRHHRICVTTSRGDSTAIEAALAAGSARYLDDLAMWSQPGVFSWDRTDPGSARLLENLPLLSGVGADFGCGIGTLARAVLVSPKVKQLHMLDIDRRAIEMARRNISDARANAIWADARTTKLAGLDFIVMNPPFHEGAHENQALGQSFIKSAAAALRAGGTCWLTANRHLPYERILKPLFRRVTLLAEVGGYKIYQGLK
jgi:16S rRNA (guanine1207-N2)-methyltransferase